ncbi:hypothetical protein SANTM175S_09779 [Streptomyces antimycoticus]
MARRTMTVVELSDAAAEAIRQLNHATGKPDGLEYPGDAYSTVANLKTLVQRLPQALEQIEAFITGLHTDGHLTSDRGRPIEDEIDAVQASLNGPPETRSCWPNGSTRRTPRSARSATPNSCQGRRPPTDDSPPPRRPSCPSDDFGASL